MSDNLSPLVLTEGQQAWALTHDWCIGVRNDGSVWVRDTVVTSDGIVISSDYVWCESFRALRVWAGY